MVEGVGYRNYGVYNTPETTTDVKAYRNIQEPPVGTANFEGRRDFDSFEKKESHTGRNIAIGTGIAAAALYTLAALLGRGKGLKIGKHTFGKFVAKDGKELNFIKKGINACIDGSYKSAKAVKKYTYDPIVKLFAKKGGGTGGADGAANA